MDVIWILIVILPVLAIAFFISSWADARYFEKDSVRIAAYLRNGGNALLEIKSPRLSGIGGRWRSGYLGSIRTYNVTFRSRDGQTLTSRCLTGRTIELYWSGPTPPTSAP